MNPAVVLVIDVMGTDWHVTSRRLLSIVYWRQIPFDANALIVFWAKVKQPCEITTLSLHRISNS